MRTLARFLLLIIVVFTSWFYWNHGKESYLFYGDSLGYYSYLPSFFIYDNFDSIEKLPADKGIEQPVLDYISRYPRETERSPKGFYINQYTYGVAAFELPFFLIAHIYEKNIGGPANGYSLIYHQALKVGFLFFGLLGLFILYKIVRRFFNKNVSMLSLIFLLGGTNLFWFIFYQGGMSHTILFMLYAALIYFTIVLHEVPAKRFNYLMMGLIAGAIVVIRPTDIICLAIPVLYNVYSIETLKEKWELIMANLLSVFYAVILFLLPIIPQLIFWKKYTGSFIYYSYKGQSFNWSNPMILEGVFGFKNGWIAYSPIIICALLGLLLYRKIRPFSLIIWIVLPLYIYIIYSWWCWNYINGYGSRPMVHLYPLLIFPLAALIDFVKKKGLLIRSVSLMAIIFLVLVNINLIMKVLSEKMISAESNAAFYFSTLFRKDLNYEDLVTFQTGQRQPDSTSLNKAALLAFHDFEKMSDSNHHLFDAQLNSGVYLFEEGQEFPHIAFRDTLDKTVEGQYIQCAALIKIPELMGDMWRQPTLTISIKRADNNLLWKGIALNNKIGWGADYCKHEELTLNHQHENEWGRVYFYAKLNDIELQAGDVIEYGPWNIAKKKLLVDDLSISIWQ